MAQRHAGMTGEERNPNRDDESGQYAAGFTLEETLDALRALGGTATTGEVGDELGCARRTAYNKLRTLEDEGRITSRETGAARLWFASDADTSEADA